MKRWWAAVVLAAIPAAAWACPVCANRPDANPAATYGLLAALLSVPYVAGVVVVRMVRRLDDGSSQE